MNYADFTREELLKRIEELEILNQELLKEQEQEIMLDYAWTGNLGHWYWNIKTNEVTSNPLKITALGYEKNEIPKHVTYQFFADRLHPEDYENTMNVMRDHLHGKASIYEVEYRIKAKNGKYKWYYDRGKITQYDNNGKPLLLAGIVFDITKSKESVLDLEQKNKILAKQAATDGLTKINNYRSLMEKLKLEMLESNKNNKPLSIAIFDIDDFKKVNDTRGHVCGDKVLVEVTSIIKKSIRDNDFPGRYGGEEFMVILPNTNLIEAVKIAERIRKTVEDNLFNEDLKITISGGVKQYNGGNLMEFVHSADLNLYGAKKQGKNKIIMK